MFLGWNRERGIPHRSLLASDHLALQLDGFLLVGVERDAILDAPDLRRSDPATDYPDLGDEDPTPLLTNQLTRSARELIRRYAQQMVIEHNIADGIDFFHMDALSSEVAMKVDCDLKLTLMASSLNHLLGQPIGNGCETAKSRHLFRDLVEATAQVTTTDQEVEVRFQKRAHNPLLSGCRLRQ